MKSLSNLKVNTLSSDHKWRKALLFSIFSLAGAASLLYMSYRYENNLRQLYVINEGVNTCFKRVVQTFMAVSTRELSSIYVSKNFNETTQECIGDVATWSELVQGKSKKNIESLVNTFSSEFFWFERNLSLANDSDKWKQEMLNKFESIENIHYGLLESVSRERGVLKRYISAFNLIVLAFGGLLFVSLIRLYYVTQRFQKNLMKIDEMAQNELERSPVPLGNQVEEIVTELCDLNGARQVHKLFLKYHISLLDQSMLSSGKNSILNERAERRDKLEGIPLNLSSMLLQKIGQTSKLFFGMGVTMKMDVGEDTFIWGRMDVLDKLINSLFETMIDQLEKAPEAMRKVMIQGRNSENAIGHYDLQIIAPYFNKNDQKVQRSNELFDELMKLLNGQCYYEDKFEKELQESDIRYHFQFRLAMGDERQLHSKQVSLFKGTKKQVLDKMGSKL